MDDKLIAALPAVHQEVARSFQPSGLVNVEAFIRRPAGAQKFVNRYLNRFHHASIRYKEFPYPLEDVSAIKFLGEVPRTRELNLKQVRRKSKFLKEPQDDDSIETSDWV